MKWLVILVCACIYARSESFPTPTTSILGLTKMIIQPGWDILENRSDIDSLKYMKKNQRLILKKINMLDKNITYASQMVANVRLETMSEVVTYLAKTAKVQIKFNDLIQHIDTIDTEYRRMLTYVTNKNGVNRSTLEDFARNAVLSHHASSVRMCMEKIHGFLAPKRKLPGQSSLLGVLSTLKDLDNNSICMSRQSPNQFLYNLYNIISLTYLKAYAMIQFSYMLLEIYGKGSFTGEVHTMRNDFVNRTVEFTDEIRAALNRTSVHFWRCDPQKYQIGINYLQITQLLQGYIQNEVALNKRGTCKEDCSFYKQTKSHNCGENQYCRKQRECRGNILNCQAMESHMYVCPDSPYSGRRYKYIEYDNGKILGRKGYCYKRNEVQKWSHWLFWECSYCMCLCDEESIYSDRYFSLRSAVSNVIQNRVVTGIRLIKMNRIIHLQVQQGELLPQGVINGSTLEWVAVTNFRKDDRFVYNRQDYFKLNWKERSINLDVLKGKNGTILTGVRFHVMNSHLNFEIRVTAFDFETGKLTDPKQSSGWIYNINTEYSYNKRTKINVENVDVPIRTTSPSKIISNHNEFLQFTHTDFEKDAAQTTVPFIDAQDVVPDVPIPLTGAGVYFKSTEGYGGFIGLKLITYDFYQHLNYILKKT